MIRDGYARQVLCGGADSLFSVPTYGAWNNLGAMSRNADPLRAARPFDRDRDGFVMGEGAGAFLLEQGLRAVNLEGGMTAWHAAGAPLVAEDGEPYVA